MSINSMTNSAAARRSDFAPLDTVPKDFSQIAMAAVGMPASKAVAAAVATRGVVTADTASGGATTQPNPVNTAMSVLFGYIPTEVLTLYVATVAAISPASGSVPTTVAGTEWVNFFLFLGATPAIFWVVYATKLRAAGKSLPLGYKDWPVWEMFAATTAYVAWAFALPSSPFREFSAWYSPAIAGVAVLVVSTILGLLAPLFQNKL